MEPNTETPDSSGDSVVPGSGPAIESMRLPTEIILVEVGSFFGLKDVLKLSLVCKPYLQQALSRCLRSLTITADLRWKYLIQHKDRLALRKLSVLAVRAIPSQFRAELMGLLNALPQLRDLTLKIRCEKIDSNLPDYFASTLPRFDHLESLMLQTPWVTPQIVREVGQKCTSLKRLFLFATISDRIDPEQEFLSTLTQLTNLECLHVSMVVKSVEKLKRLTGLQSLMYYKYNSEDPSSVSGLLEAISAQKEIMPPKVGINGLNVFSLAAPNLLYKVIRKGNITEFLDEKVLDLLLEAGARVSDDFMNLLEFPPLMTHFVKNRCRLSRFLEWAQRLLNAGANPCVNGPNSVNSIWTIMEENVAVEVVKRYLLLVKEKWFDRVSWEQLFWHPRDGTSILHFLASSNNNQNNPKLPLLRYFTSKEGLELIGNPPVDIVDSAGRTPAMVALDHESMQVLFNAGANPNVKNSYGTSLLCYKAASGPTKSVKILLKRTDVLLPNPANHDHFMSVFLASFAVQNERVCFYMISMATWVQIYALIDRLFREMRGIALSKPNWLEFMDWEIAVLFLASERALELKDSAKPQLDGIFLWDIFSIRCEDARFITSLERMLQAGFLTSWTRGSSKSNVIIQAIKHKFLKFVPIAIRLLPQLITTADDQGLCAVDYFNRLHESSGASVDAELMESCIAAFQDAGIKL